MTRDICDKDEPCQKVVKKLSPRSSLAQEMSVSTYNVDIGSYEPDSEISTDNLISAQTLN